MASASRGSNTSKTSVEDRTVVGVQPDTSTPTGTPTGGITNAQLSKMAANTVKANATASSATPTDLALAASTIVARLAAGNLKAATVTEILTLLGATGTGNTWPNSTMAPMAADTVKVNATSGSTNPSDLVMGASTILARLASGDIVAATVAQILTLLGSPWPNNLLANMAAATIKGNNGGGSASPSDLTAAQTAALIAGGTPVSSTVTAALAKLTGGGANGSLVITTANGLVTALTYTAPT